jgi:hypothetical protein
MDRIVGKYVIDSSAVPFHNQNMDRRTERRYAVQQRAAVAVLSYGTDQTYAATIADLSRSGIGLRISQFLVAGTEIAVQFDEVLIFGTVQHCKERGSGQFAVGAKITSISGSLKNVKSIGISRVSAA